MPNQNTPDDNQKTDDLSFQVMPSNQPGGEMVDNSPVTPSHQTGGTLPSEEHHPLNNKLTYIIVTVIVLAILGAIAYFLLGAKPEQEEAATRLPKPWLQQHFNVAVCDNQSVCGDEADPDNDGLNNYDEFKVRGGTNPKNSDSDNDGIADGDEVHIYATEPASEFSMCRNSSGVACQYNDGSQIANDYDPTTPGAKFTETRKNQIQANIETYKLHEPTPTTLQKLKTGSTTTGTTDTTSTAPQTHAITIEGGKFVPATLTINANDSVVWLNKELAQHEVASDPHPAHTGLAGLVSAPLSQNQTYSFKFENAGTFTYHDHLNPTIKGTITVK